MGDLHDFVAKFLFSSFVDAINLWAILPENVPK